MSERVQSFENHGKIVPGYHGWTTALLMVPTIYFLVVAVRDFSVATLLMALFAVGVNIAAFYARVFPLGVQDRLIRLEERMRMERLLPEELKARIQDFTTDQLIGLRFASDEELPDLARRVLDEGISDRKEIKRAIRSWRPDDQRI